MDGLQGLHFVPKLKQQKKDMLERTFMNNFGMLSMQNSKVAVSQSTAKQKVYFATSV